jgi:hypothetical protein
MADPNSGSSLAPGWAAARWRKSSHSPDGPPGCLECAAIGDRVGVRDSNDPDGPMLLFGRQQWADFIAGVKAGEFDRPR